MDAQVLWMTLVVICFCFKAQAVTPQNLTCDLDDLRALQETVNDGWGKHIPHPIAAFEISQNSLNGSLPSHIYDNSSALHILKLAVNHFSGHLLPSLGDCSSLEHFFLETNYITGGIYGAIFRLQKLTQMSLQDNRLFGPLSTRIGNLTNPVGNRFSGPVPDNLPPYQNRNNVNLARNNFMGQTQIPETLVLSFNFRNKELPAHLALHFGKLRILIIANCGLRGSL
ncbi:LRR domain containing protein [Trema orientale]|uniref:LRR domain containing protein n=1 Tax=Trema orientale TaxID=63057 RepID=A0A2P5C0Y9_TREOI|nr:LRR domain containing protein [Trema orientale]